MIKFAFILVALFTFNFAQAQSFKVVRIQGKKAIVEVSDPTMISVNETYNVGTSTGGGGKSSFRRDNAIDFTFSYLSQSNPTFSQMVLGGRTPLEEFHRLNACLAHQTTVSVT